MLNKCDSDTKLEPIVIAVRPDTGIADIWLNKGIETYTEQPEDEPGEPKEKYTANQAYMQHAATDNLHADIEADFEAWFEFAKDWEPSATEISDTAAQLALTNARVDMLEQCVLEMSETVYA